MKNHILKTQTEKRKAKYYSIIQRLSQYVILGAPHLSLRALAKQSLFKQVRDKLREESQFYLCL